MRIFPGRILAALSAFVLVSCGSGGSDDPASKPSTDPSVDSSIETAKQTNTVNVAATGLNIDGTGGAQLQVAVDGVLLSPQYANVTNTLYPLPFAFTADGPISEGARVDVILTNGGAAGYGADVDPLTVLIDAVQINGTNLVPADGTLDRGVGDQAFDGVDTMPGDNAFAFTGALRFLAPPVIDDAQLLPVEDDLTDAQSKASGKWCTGKPNKSLSRAKQNFKDRCGESWDAKRHQCDWKSDGFHCHGVTRASGSGDSGSGSTGSGTTLGKWCIGKPNRNMSSAKLNFKSKCGQEWNDQLGHRCDWKSDGWHCQGTTSVKPPPRAPNGIMSVRWNKTTVRLRWNRASSASGIKRYDIYANGKRIKSTRKLEYIFVDKRTTKYSVVAIGGNNVPSPSSTARRALERRSEITLPVHQTYSDGKETVNLNGGLHLNSSGATMSTMVTNHKGENLGTMQQYYTGSGASGEVVTVLRPNNKQPVTIKNPHANPTAVAPGITVGQILTAYRKFRAVPGNDRPNPNPKPGVGTPPNTVDVTCPC